jgi:uncharacterized coiled-coil protein SlyX
LPAAITTTFNTMRVSLVRWWIIAAALLGAALVAGCGTLTLRLSYGQGPRLVYWWLDNHVDVSAAQAPAAREAIGSWFGWHRSTQLPQYAEVLAGLQPRIMEPTTPQAVCSVWHDVRMHGDVALEHALPSIATFVRTLTPGQLHNIERRFAKVNAEFREEYLQPEPAQRQRATLRRSRDRVEMLYGTLHPAQRERLVQALAASPFDPERWGAERLRRQEDILHTLRALLDDRALPAAQLQARLRALVKRLQRSPRDDYVSYQERLTAHNCAVFAEIHNAATPAQREHARVRLREWERDLREMAVAGAAPG